MWYCADPTEEPARKDELGRSADLANDATPKGPRPGAG